jgi:hypothetical protein
MARYWYSTQTGFLTAVVGATRPVGHAGYEQTPDLADIPGPVACCKWNGSAVVVDAGLLATYKAVLRERIERKALIDVQAAALTTPWGDFRLRRDDIDAYQMVALNAIYALQTSSSFSMTLRRADDSSVTVTASQFMQFMALIGSRMAAKLTARDTRLNQLAAATAADLKGFTP